MTAGVQHFSYHRSVAPMMWVLVGIAGVELVVDHFLVWLWSPIAAVLLSLVTLTGVIWLVRVIRSMTRLPVALNDEALVMRVGTLKSATIVLANVAGLRTQWDAAALKERSLLNLALLAYPNVVIDLREPLAGKRCIRAVAHRFDDPAGFTAALTARID